MRFFSKARQNIRRVDFEFGEISDFVGIPVFGAWCLWWMYSEGKEKDALLAQNAGKRIVSDYSVRTFSQKDRWRLVDRTPQELLQESQAIHDKVARQTARDLSLNRYLDDPTENGRLFYFA